MFNVWVLIVPEPVETVESVETVETAETVETVLTEGLKKYRLLTHSLSY